MLTWAELYFLSEWAIRVAMLVYVPQRRSPAAARTWLLLVFIVPWPGLILYSIFGRAYLPRRRFADQVAMVIIGAIWVASIVIAAS